ncbi:MAG: DNA repair exonuclease [Pseudomonadota bacterium]
MGQGTFLHAADLHLDSPLLRLTATDEDARALVRGATRSAFVRLIDHALALPAAFVVIAGDLWDGPWQDVHTGLWFVRQVSRLRDAGIPLVFLRGNHDAASEVTPTLAFPDHVHELPTKAPGTVRLSELAVALHGQGFPQPRVDRDLAATYPAPVPGWLNVGVLHTALDGAEGHAAYAPCSIQTLTAKGYDYWALGHVHAQAIRSRDPWIVFPGNLQGRHANETGPKGCFEVDFEGDRILAVRAIGLDVVRWERPLVDLTSAIDLDDVDDRVVEALRATPTDPRTQLLVVRPTLAGATALRGELLASKQLLSDRISGRAAELPVPAVVEGLTWALTDPTEPGRPLDDDAVGALIERLAGLAAAPETKAALEEAVASIVRDLPHDVTSLLADGALGPLMRGEVDGYLADRRDAAIARVRGPASGEDERAVR